VHRDVVGSVRSGTGLTRPDVRSRPCAWVSHPLTFKRAVTASELESSLPAGSCPRAASEFPMAVTTQRGAREEGSGGAMLAAERALGATAVGPVLCARVLRRRSVLERSEQIADSLYGYGLELPRTALLCPSAVPSSGARARDRARNTPSRCPITRGQSEHIPRPEVPVEAQQLPRARELARALDGVPIRRSAWMLDPAGRTERGNRMTA
jgi:predicted Zn-ribbon and HTH transcriptional regulator